MLPGRGPYLHFSPSHFSCPSWLCDSLAASNTHNTSTCYRMDRDGYTFDLEFIYLELRHRFWFLYCGLCSEYREMLALSSCQKGQNGCQSKWKASRKAPYVTNQSPSWKLLCTSKKMYNKVLFLFFQIKSNVIGFVHIFSRWYCGCSEMLVFLAPTVN